MKILPAIDLKNGNCVRLLKGDFNKVTEYNSDPLAQVEIFKSNDLNNLHIVDLARSHPPCHLGRQEGDEHPPRKSGRAHV